MKENTSVEIRVGMFVILTLCILGFFIAKARNLNFSRDGYELRTHFVNVQGLKPQANVYLSGVKVGEVQSLQPLYAQGRVEASLWIEKTAQIPRKSQAQIAVGGLFGDKSVWITMGKSDAGFLSPGDELATAESFDISTALSSIANIMGKGEQFIDSAKILVDSLKGHADKISERVVGMLDENRENIRVMIKNFAEVGPDLKDAAAKFSSFMTRVQDTNGTVWKLLKEDDVYNDIRAITHDVREVVSSNKANISNVLSALGDSSGAIRSAMSGLKIVMDKVSKGEGTIGKLIHDDSLYREAKKTIKEIGDAAEGVQDKSSLGSLISVAVSAAK